MLPRKQVQRNQMVTTGFCHIIFISWIYPHSVDIIRIMWIYQDFMDAIIILWIQSTLATLSAT